MKPELVGHNVRAKCPGCEGSVSTFEFKSEGKEFGYIIREAGQPQSDHPFRVIFRLLRCAGCGRGGLVALADVGDNVYSLIEFFPRAVDHARLPEAVPDFLQKEVHEAELCMSLDANRGASALLRSALEKALAANGYVKGSLRDRIDEAAEDGVITEARKSRAHDDVRVLGNDVLHDDWRAITSEEAAMSLHYVQRVLEDLYDERETVTRVLVAAGRLPAPEKQPDSEPEGSATHANKASP